MLRTQQQKKSLERNSLKSVMVQSGVELGTSGETQGMDLPLPVLTAEELGFIARLKGLTKIITNLVLLTLL